MNTLTWMHFGLVMLAVILAGVLFYIRTRRRAMEWLSGDVTLPTAPRSDDFGTVDPNKVAAILRRRYSALEAWTVEFGKRWIGMKGAGLFKRADTKLHYQHRGHRHRGYVDLELVQIGFAFGVLMFVCFLLGAAAHRYACLKQWEDSGHAARWALFSGCQIQRADGTWIPAKNYREVP